MLPVHVSFGGEDAEVLYAGAAPTLAAGLLQINARLPKISREAQPVPVVVKIGNAQSQSGVTDFHKAIIDFNSRASCDSNPAISLSKYR